MQACDKSRDTQMPSCQRYVGPAEYISTRPPKPVTLCSTPYSPSFKLKILNSQIDRETISATLLGGFRKRGLRVQGVRVWMTPAKDLPNFPETPFLRDACKRRVSQGGRKQHLPGEDRRKGRTSVESIGWMKQYIYIYTLKYGNKSRHMCVHIYIYTGIRSFRQIHTAAVLYTGINT